MPEMRLTSFLELSVHPWVGISIPTLWSMDNAGNEVNLVSSIICSPLGWDFSFQALSIDQRVGISLSASEILFVSLCFVCSLHFFLTICHSADCEIQLCSSSLPYHISLVIRPKFIFLPEQFQRSRSIL